MRTLHVFGRQYQSGLSVLPLKEVNGKMVEDKNHLLGEWNWPGYIKPFLGKRKTLSEEICRDIQKLGVCEFIQHIDPMCVIDLG